MVNVIVLVVSFDFYYWYKSFIRKHAKKTVLFLDDTFMKSYACVPVPEIPPY